MVRAILRPIVPEEVAADEHATCDQQGGEATDDRDDSAVIPNTGSCRAILSNFVRAAS